MLIHRKSKKIIINLIIFLLIFNLFNISIDANNNARPDLTIQEVDFSKNINNLYEGDEVLIKVKIANIQSSNPDENLNITDESIVVSLKIDDTLIKTNGTINDLSIGQSVIVNFTWNVTLTENTERTIYIFVDYGNNINERNENNNAWDSNIYVYEKQTDLRVIDVIFSNELTANKNTDITVKIKNYGKETDETFTVRFCSSIDGIIETLLYDDELLKNNSANFSFNWTPSRFGSQYITFEIFYKGSSHHINKQDVKVRAYRLNWWNESWHYRYYLSVTGTGNISSKINFTGLLNDIDVFSSNFENETIRIIKYSLNGDIVDVVENYSFVESEQYDPINNATGNLTWNVTGSSSEKYYCIYFDVLENRGVRNKLTEKENMMVTDDTEINFYGISEGWWTDILKPSEDDYFKIGDKLNLTFYTKSKANIVKAKIMHESQQGIYDINLTNVEKYTLWENNTFVFDEEGLWTIAANCSDDAGYRSNQTLITCYVGKPDLYVDFIKIESTDEYTAPDIYNGDLVNITGFIQCTNASPTDVKILLEVYKLNDLIHTDNKTLDINCNENTSVLFEWKVNVTGVIKFIITVDADDTVDELSESNNKLINAINIIEWPDLRIDSIDFPLSNFNEYDNITINVDVSNIDGGDAVNYEMVLYIESVRQGYVKYQFEKYRLSFNLSQGSSKSFDLYWDPALPGEYYVGVMIIVNEIKKDINIDNNRMFAKTLKVVRIEEVAPVISNVRITPDVPEQGDTLTIFADVTDDTGIDFVDINIKFPNGDEINDDMVRVGSSKYQFIIFDLVYSGRYSIVIDAEDTTVKDNHANFSYNFTVLDEDENPVIFYVGADPMVQYPNESVEIYCIADDNIEIDYVEITIFTPDDDIIVDEMVKENDRYVYKNVYEVLGKYDFSITVEDKAGITSNASKYFWITEDLDDIDNDGLPNEWEERYGLDPYNANDAKKDLDKDGITNKEEYELGSNPDKNIQLQNIGSRIRENVGYLTISLIFFIIIIIFSIIILRRR